MGRPPVAQPISYSRQYNFTNYQTVSPSDPLPADKVDLELNSVKLTLDQILSNLALLQRDDTALANESVGYDQLKAELNGFGFNPPTTWVTATNYVVRDTVFNGAKFYQCLVSHVSGVFATDLAAGDWLLIADFNVNPVETQTVAASAVTTIADANLVAITETTGPTLKKITWANFKATIWAAIASITGKTTPVGADTLVLSDSAAAGVGKSLTFTNLWATTLAAFGPLVASLTAKSTPVDADGVMIVDSAASNAPKFLSWANLKATVWAFLRLKAQRTNREWNPACEVSQQNGTTLGTTNGYFPADNIAMYFTAATAAMSVQQIVGPTANGSAHQIEYKCTTAKAGLSASDFVALTTKIEGLDVADLKYGTASAIAATRSFQFKGPAGTYHLHGQNRSGNRHISIPFSPAVANTEERITVVVPGDTTGTWTVDTDTLITWDIILAAGSTLTGGSASTWSGSTFYAASAQKNILDSTANVVRVGDFDFSPDPDGTGVAQAWVPVKYDDALQKSQRYWAPNPYASGYWAAGTNTDFEAQWMFPAPMRSASPTFALISGTGAVVQPDVGSFNASAVAAASDTLSVRASVTTGASTVEKSAILVGGKISVSARLT